MDVIIIGAGLSGLSTAYFLEKQQPGLKVVLLEAGERPGGAVCSHNSQGYLLESGPHGYLDNKPVSQEILSDLGLDQQLQKAPLADFQRFICRQGRLVALPQKPQQLLASSLLSWPAKLRLLADLWKKPLAGQPTIGQWASYRFGKGVLPMVDAAVTGTFSGDYQRLLIDAVMPGARQLEKEYGSLLRGLKKKPRQGKKGLPAMINFPGGMETLVRSLAKGRDIRYGCQVKEVRHNLLQGSWSVLMDEAALEARQVVIALPVNGCLQLLADFEPPRSSMPVSRIYNIAFGCEDQGVVPKGFGYLAPEEEQRFVLGCMFTSRMFPGRAPQGQLLLEALVGGRRHPERLELDDGELISKAWQDLRSLLDLPEKPSFSQVLRPQAAIPQMEEGHLELKQWRQQLQGRQKGLHICGFGWDGIGVNDVTLAAKEAADAICQGEQADKAEVEVKPVYF